MKDQTRSNDFLELVRRSRQGRLKVFLGPAAGVGKTYRMLQEAHELHKRGVDVVIGAIETHGRPETAALLMGLEYVPPRKIEYRGVCLDEMDLDAVLARKPEVVVVDEVAHTNAPGSRYRKRHQDILELLRANINVFCAFNIQHLESLNDVIRRETHVKVHETVPDSFLRRADQIVNIDLPADDLLERLRVGKIYPPQNIHWALDNFFKSENLETLRELALREVAEAIGRGPKKLVFGEVSQEQMAMASNRLLVCFSTSPRARALIRRASRLAGRLNAHWFAVYIETSREAPSRIDATTQRLLFASQQLARNLGAEVHHIRADNPVEGILEFARAYGVTDIAVGSSRPSFFRQLFARTVPQLLIKRAQGFDLHVLSTDEKAYETIIKLL